MRDSMTAELRPVLEAIEIVGPDAFTLAGRRFPPEGDSLATRTPAGLPVITWLQHALYEHCYIRRFTGSVPDAAPALSPAADDDLVPLLSAANATRERLDPGWQLEEVLSTGQFLAHKHGRRRFLWPGEFVTSERDGRTPAVGRSLSIFQPRESVGMQPGFYFAFGDTIADAFEDAAILRFYWNVDAAGAPALIGALTRTLNAWAVPFQAKCFRHRSLYNRRDAAVVFMHRRHFRLAAELLSEVHAEVREHVRDDTPLFTRALAPGLAVAEDPGTGESFGMSRCRCVAEAIWAAYDEGSQAADGRLAHLSRTFAAQGLDLDRPYASSGFAAQYDADASSLEVGDE